MDRPRDDQHCRRRCAQRSGAARVLGDRQPTALMQIGVARNGLENRWPAAPSAAGPMGVPVLCPISPTASSSPLPGTGRYPRCTRCKKPRTSIHPPTARRSAWPTRTLRARRESPSVRAAGFRTIPCSTASLDRSVQLRGFVPGVELGVSPPGCCRSAAAFARPTRAPPAPTGRQRDSSWTLSAVRRRHVPRGHARGRLGVQGLEPDARGGPAERLGVPVVAEALEDAASRPGPGPRGDDEPRDRAFP